MSSAPAEDGETVCGVSSDGSDESEDVEEGDVVVVVEEEGFDEPTELFKFDGGPRFNGLYQRKGRRTPRKDVYMATHRNVAKE